MNKKDEIAAEAYLAIIIWWILWMFIISNAVYFVKSNLLFVFAFWVSCLLVILLCRLQKKARMMSEDEVKEQESFCTS